MSLIMTLSYVYIIYFDHMHTALEVETLIYL